MQIYVFKQTFQHKQDATQCQFSKRKTAGLEGVRLVIVTVVQNGDGDSMYELNSSSSCYG